MVPFVEFQVVLFHGCECTKTSFREIPPHYLNTHGRQIAQFKALDLHACVYLCSKEYDCGSFSYSGPTAECILYSKITTETSLSFSAYSTYIKGKLQFWSVPMQWPLNTSQYVCFRLMSHSTLHKVSIVENGRVKIRKQSTIESFVHFRSKT